MSNSKGRIRKLSDPFKKNPLNDNNYRRAKKYLELETGSRCCYSMQHKDLALGDVGMEVEHFKPKKKFPRKANAYKNLLYASRHCNNSKNDNWPNPSQRKKGLRFINPSTEMDYGVHIFEDIKSGKLVGVTPAGYYHIVKCDLNAEFLCKQRLSRSILRKLISGTPVLSNDLAGFDDLNLYISEAKEILEKEIPYIPELPKDKLNILNKLS